MRVLAFLFLIFISPIKGQSFLSSINYYPGNSKDLIVNAGQAFVAPPSTLQVADICARISGLRPLLWEDQLNLPAKPLGSSAVHQPVVVEVHGGVLPDSVVPIIRSSVDGLETNYQFPTVNDVVRELQSKGVEASGYTITHQDNVNLKQYLAENVDQPLIILHHESKSSESFPLIGRVLSSTTNSTNSTVPLLTEQQISQYQICLWTGLAFVLLILASICSIINMEVIPDSLLYAKFQSGRTEGKRD